MLVPLIAGDVRTCFGVYVRHNGHIGYRLTYRSTEPNTGLETLKLRTRAVRDGDYYKISGQKMYSYIRTSAHENGADTFM